MSIEMSCLGLIILGSLATGLDMQPLMDHASHRQHRYVPGVSPVQRVRLAKRDNLKEEISISVISGENDSFPQNRYNCIIQYIGPITKEGNPFPIDKSIKLVEIILTKSNFSNDKSIVVDLGHMFKPDYWAITTGKHGRGLLMLRHIYPILSMQSLAIGVKTIHSEIIDSPPGCLFRQNGTEIENLIRRFILNNLTLSAEVDSTVQARVCNLNMLANKSYAVFSYICCEKTVDGDLLCKQLQTDSWLEILFVFIFILKFSVFLLCPLLVPDEWYKSELGMSRYSYLPEKGEVSITLVKRIEKKEGEGDKCVKRHKFQNMNNFAKTLDSLDTDRVYRLTVSRAILDVKARRLINENHVPVKLARSIYRTLFRCKVRDYKAIGKCCRSNVFGQIETVKIPWFICLQQLMNSVAMAMALIPWIVRLVIFYTYEQDTIDAKQKMAQQHGLRTQFEGDMTLFLTPLHSLFILVYAVIMIDSVLFGILRKKMKEKSCESLRACLCDVSRESRYRVFGWASQLLLQPFEWYGIGGVVVGPIFWAVALPVCACVIVVRMVPLINLIFQLLTRMFSQCIGSLFNRTQTSLLVRKVNTWLLLEMLEDAVEGENTIQQVTYIPEIKGICQDKFLRHTVECILEFIIIIFSLISVYSVAFLFLEFVSFLVEIICYTLIGIVLNAGKTMSFVSLTFLLILYGHDSFKSVDIMYMQFIKVIHKIFCERAGTMLKDICKLKEEKQTNTVFAINPATTDDDGGNNEDEDQRILKLMVKNGNVKWESHGFLLFLDKKDIPYIPNRFFTSMCEQPHHGCPGPVHSNFLKALAHFLIIVLFLAFVGIIVMAFGDSYRVSSTNQMLATLAGGFLPWILKNILFKSKAALTLDTSDWKFQCALDTQIRMKQTWPVSDIVIENQVTSIIDDCNSDGDNSRCSNVDIIVLDRVENRKETSDDKTSMV